MNEYTRLDIITDVGVFVMEVDPAEYVVRGDQGPAEYVVRGDQGPDEGELFTMTTAAVKRGEWFHGWTPEENPDLVPPAVLNIEDGAQIKAFKLYTVPFVKVEGFSTEATPTPATPYPFTCFGEYLGNKLKITGVAFQTPTTEYLLPIMVNDQPATEYMKPAPLSQQIQLAKEAQGLAPTEYLIVIPDMWLDFHVATDYLASYVQEAEPMTKVDGESKAAAWAGWKQ